MHKERGARNGGATCTDAEILEEAGEDVFVTGFADDFGEVVQGVAQFDADDFEAGGIAEGGEGAVDGVAGAVKRSVLAGVDGEDGFGLVGGAGKESGFDGGFEEREAFAGEGAEQDGVGRQGRMATGRSDLLAIEEEGDVIRQSDLSRERKAGGPRRHGGEVARWAGARGRGGCPRLRWGRWNRAGRRCR